MKKRAFATGKYLVFVWIFYLQGIFTPITLFHMLIPGETNVVHSTIFQMAKRKYREVK